MDALTIHEAAETTGWSPRMLRYVERVGLVEPARSASGYRLYGPAELQRLRTLRELLEAHGIGLSDLAFAQRLRHDPELRAACAAWLEAEAERPADVPAADWLGFEQRQHQALLEGAAAKLPTPLMETGSRRPTPSRRPTSRSPTSRLRPGAARRSSSPSTRCP